MARAAIRYGARVRKSRPPLYKWRHFEPAVITCAVGWYLRFSLSYRNVEELLTERGLPADHCGSSKLGPTIESTLGAPPGNSISEYDVRDDSARSRGDRL